MRTLLVLLAVTLLTGCLSTENADFRAEESPSSFGSGPGQADRGSSTFERSQSADETPQDAGR